MEYLGELAYIAIVLLIGTLASILAYYLKTSDIFILLLTGMIFSSIGLISFKEEFVVLVSVLALIFIVFNSTVKFKVDEIKKYLIPAIKLNLVYFLLCVLILTPSVIYFAGLGFSFSSVLLGILFSALVYGSDPTVILSFFKTAKNRIVKIIEIESIINTPVTVIISLLVLTLLGGTKFKVFTLFNNPLTSFVQSIVVGLIVPIILAWMIVTVLKKNNFGELTHLAVLTAAILVYIISEYLGGSGVLSIAVFGLIFGNSHISHLIEIEKFESILSNIIKILTFMLLGTIIFIKSEYIISGSFIFLVSVVIRFISVYINFRDMPINHKLFMTLNVPKGVDEAVVLLFIISLYPNISNISVIINLVMLMIIYSIILSGVSSQFSKYFLGGNNVAKIKGN